MSSSVNLINSLKNISKREKIAYIEIVFRFFAEEFLRRLSKTQFKDKLILRGGYLVNQLTDFEGITDKTLDFLYIDSDEKQLDVNNVISNIISADTKFNFCEFSAGSAEKMVGQTGYNGYRINITAKIGSIRLNFDVNIGIGDILFHQTEELSIVSILSDDEKNEILSYPVESVISEKLDIILKRFELNNCMKHMYDIVLLSKTFDFDGYELQRAINATLKNRKNDCNANRLKEIGELSADADMLKQWQHFALKNAIELKFNEVLNCMLWFLEPVYDSINHESRWQKNWSGSNTEWDEPLYLY